MLDILQTYLNGAASPEFTQMIREAHESLDLFINDDYQGDFTQLLMLDDAVDAGETVQNILDCTKNYQLQVLKQLGIDADPETRVDNLTRLLRGIYDVEHSEDPAKVLERATLELHPPELLAEILAVCTATPPEEWLVDLHDVSQMTIQKIIENASQMNAIKQGAKEPEVDHRTPYILAYKAFKETLLTIKGQPTLLLDKAFLEGMDVGYPFVLYLNLTGDEIGTLEPVPCAANLIAAALVSTDGHEKVREVIEAHLEHYVHDLDKLTKVTICVSDLLLRHQQRITTGVKTNAPA
jgi:hypothetical protein